jgi:hypothetical protein
MVILDVNDSILVVYAVTITLSKKAMVLKLPVNNGCEL